MDSVVITSAVRTAVGNYLGSLKTVPAHDLGTVALQGAIEQGGVEGTDLDEIILGQACPDGEAPNIARIVGLELGLEEVPAYSLNRMCASSAQAVINAVQEIRDGMADVVAAGGAESMSRIVYYLPPSVRYEGLRLGNKEIYDGFMHASDCAAPPELYPNASMGMTSENVADKCGISRQQCDEFAAGSQQKAAEAAARGAFNEEIVPVTVKLRKKEFVYDTDETVRPGTTAEVLAKLRTSFKKDGVTTAGNASGMNDGASAVVVMKESEAASRGIRPMARVVDYAVGALDPRIMGLGPVVAVRKLLKRTGLSLDDMDLIELNEAFAAQSLGVLKELDMLPGTKRFEKVNVNGGAIALGHALGSSGTRLIATITHELRRRGGRLGLVTMCIGGGQGIAMLLENID